MLLSVCSEEGSLDPLDVDDNGHSIFEYIDVENTRYLRQKAKLHSQFFYLQSKLLKEDFQHKQNLRAIWLSFGVQASFGHEQKKTKLTARQKKSIKKKVKLWSKTDPQSGCKYLQK